MNNKLYNFEVPKELIANKPSPNRDGARLFVYDTRTGEIKLDTFSNLAEYLPSNSLVVLNDTKVVKARTHLTKETGGKIEIFFLINEWDRIGNVPALVDRKLNIGDKVFFDTNTFYTVVDQKENIFYLSPKDTSLDLFSLLEKYGETPLPPYIKNTSLSTDQIDERYQTIFANKAGSVAAPTASLHFTPEVLKSLEQRDVEKTFITLDVGLGTFAPITDENIQNKKLHHEYFEISKDTAQKINRCKQNRKPLIAVGTTVVRTLESAAPQILDKSLDAAKAIRASTDIFIMPPFEFKITDHLITNFHLPGTSLLMLVEAFLQHKKSTHHINELYQIAIENQFRFYSFGDSMLIL